MTLLNSVCGLAAACALAAWLPTLAAAPAKPPALAPSASAPAAAKQFLIDINTADLSTLQTLPGVTGEVAAKIVAQRPYLTKAHLLTRKIVSDDVYEAIRKSIVARPVAPMKARKAASAASKPQ